MPQVGDIMLSGWTQAPAKKKTLKMDADPQCGSANSNPVYKQSFIIDEKNNLANLL